MTYLIQFEEDNNLWWAGWYGEGLGRVPGFAPTPATAIEFPTRDKAETFLLHSYGVYIREVGSVIEKEEEP